MLKNFCVFSLVTKNVKSRKKVILFSNGHGFEIYFQKKKTITFCTRKSSKLHKKAQFCIMTITFSLSKGKQEQALYPFGSPKCFNEYTFQCFQGLKYLCLCLSISISFVIDNNLSIHVCAFVIGISDWFCSSFTRGYAHFLPW